MTERDPETELCGTCGGTWWRHTVIGAEEGKHAFIPTGRWPGDRAIVVVVNGRPVAPEDATLAEARAVLAYAEKFRT